MIVLANEVLQQSCHEAGTYVLECQGGAVEQLQCIDVVLDFHHRTVERQCVINDFLEGIRFDILAKEGVGNGIGNLLECLGLYGVKEILRQLLDTFGHIESAIFCKSLDYCFLQVGDGRIPIGTIIFHVPLSEFCCKDTIK